MEQPHVFSEKEASEILQRAARLQETTGGDSYAAGLTLDELKRIAAEAGIDEQYVLQALNSPRHTETRLLNLVEVTEHVVAGEMTPERMDEFAAVMSRYGRVQQATQIGRSFTGNVVSGAMYAKVDLSSKNGRTRIRVTSSPFMAYFLGLHVPMILSVVLAVPLVKFAGVALGLSIVFMLLFMAGLLFTTFTRMGKAKARAMSDEIAKELATTVAPEPLSIPTTAAKSDAEEQPNVQNLSN